MKFDVKINERELEKWLDQVGQTVQKIVSDTARETTDKPLDDAVSLLQRRLNRVDGLNMNRAWCQNALETLLAGKPLTIRLE